MKNNKVHLITSKIKSIVLTIVIFISFSFGNMNQKALAQEQTEEANYIGYTNPVLLGTFGDIKMYGSECESITIPFDGNLARTVVMENTGDKKVVISLNADAFLSGSGTKYADAGSVVRHPNPGSVYLKPGERKPIVTTCEMDSFGKSCKNQDLIMNVSFNVNGENYKIELKNKLTVLSKEQVRSYKDTGIIKGKVVDSNGKAISGVTVLLRNNVLEKEGYINQVVTNKNGAFSFKVPTYRNQSNGAWSTYTVVVNPPTSEYGGSRNDGNYMSSYGVKYKVIALTTGKTSKATYKLGKAAAKLKYTTKKVVDLGVQAYTYDASDDGDVIALIPFHAEGFPDSAQKLTVTNKTGKVWFTKALGKETPAGDVSPDGKYIVTTLNDQTTTSKVVIYDRSGKEVYSCAPIRSNNDWDCIYGKEVQGYAEVKLSDDGKFLAIGNWTDSLFLVDWKNDKILWEVFCKGMVREIKFDGDYIYASSGDGYLRCYSLSEGKQMWELYIMGWACDLEVSEHYIAATAKQAGAPLYVFNKEDGQIKWTYPLEKRGNGIRISANEKYIWCGNDINGGINNLQNVVFSMSTGKPLYVLPGSAQMVSFFNNDKYIAVKNGSWVGIFLTSTGEQVWTKNLAPEGGGDSISQTLWVSKDGKNLVTVVNNDPSSRFYGQAYFLQKK